MFVAITSGFVIAGIACGLAMIYRFGNTRAGLAGGIGFFWWSFASLFRIGAYFGQFDISSLNGFFQTTYVLGFILIIYSWATIPIVIEAESSSDSMSIVERPRIVTIIGALLVVLAIIGLLVISYVGVLIEFDSRFMIFLGSLGLGAVFQIGMGVGILAGMNWVRIGYFVVAPVCIVIALVFGRFSSTSIIQIVIFAVAAYCLTRPAATAYFYGRSRVLSSTAGTADH